MSENQDASSSSSLFTSIPRFLQNDDPLYSCLPETEATCPTDCVSLSSCEDCGCVVVDTEGGPWGNAADVILCLLPIAFLLAVTLKPNPLPTTKSLPLAALFMFLVRTMYLGSDPLLCSASIISGVHEALSPLSIMAGAILLFDTMEATLCMSFMMREMKLLTKNHRVAELTLLFAFAYMVEGASGFGTPVALGAPMLVSLGYDKMDAVVTLLLMNTFATVWGAVGTPIWFGFGSLEGIGEDEFLEISYKASIALAISGFVLIPTMVLSLTTDRKILWQNKIFMFLALASTIGPNVGLSFVSYEFPSLVGGMVGCVITSLLIYFRVGMAKIEGVNENGTDTNNISKESETAAAVDTGDDDEAVKDDTLTGDKNGGRPPSESGEFYFDAEEGGMDVDFPDDTKDGGGDDLAKGAGSRRTVEDKLGPRKKVGDGYIKELLLRTSPLTGVVVLLVVTRVPAIGLRDILTDRTPNFAIYFGTYGIFRCSASLVLQLQNILTYPNLNWKYELLYIPFLIPFCLMSFITMFVFRKDLQHSPRDIVSHVGQRLAKPAIALMGALVLVQLIVRSGPASPASIIGTVLADAMKAGWLAIASLIGALGSFFSGSTTVSNLTFGEVQQIAAEQIGTSVTSMLAVQATGASAGNGVCLNNIIAACAVVGLDIGEGKIIARTWKTVFLTCAISTGMIVAFFMRFN